MYLAFVLWISVSAAQNPPVAATQQEVAGRSAPESPAYTGLNQLQGLKVAAIEIKSGAVEHPEWLVPLLPQKANEPLDKYKVRRSVQVLYNSGRFSEIQVEAQRNPQGEVVLVFSARENYFFGSIRVEGAPGPPADSQLAGASKLALGEQFSEEKIQAGIQGMRRSLQENGYFNPKIQPFYEWDSRNQQVKVLFQVIPGTPARVGAVNITGEPGLPPEDIRDIAGIHSGDRVAAGRLT
ncbi:MAG TPA: POTRA domain-containing protein, partial [Candidatus Limnocylindrales bacterium]|nr:POTRA domain-containing protein [Candidatus Limnocylindrales bacterium]